MKILEAIGAFLQLVYFILTWRMGVKADEKALKKQLEVEADEAIRSGSITAIVAMYNKLRK